ncbi:MAG: hypothetical protein LBT89_08995 [Planctomycetaceae bacterium]|jgi:hypothetical protein|nr:hypothetical protein [Planctomycetaceae bacterium]
MVKPAEVEYYNLEKTAQVLSVTPAEVNRLREQNKLRAFRDGSNWKFRKVDIDNYLADIIRGRSKVAAEDDSGVADSGESDGADFDVVNDIDLPDENALVEVGAKKNAALESPESAFDLAVSADDDYHLPDEAEGTSVLSFAETAGERPVAEPEALDASVPLSEESSGVMLAEQSAPLQLSKADAAAEAVADNAEKADVDLAAHEDSDAQVKPGTEPLGLAMDSIFSEIQPGEDADGYVASEETFSLAPQADADADADDGTNVGVIEESSVLALSSDESSVILKPNLSKEPIDSGGDDFDLEPVAAAEQGGDSESSSQVIAIEPGAFAAMDTGAGGGADDPFGDITPLDDFGGGFNAGGVPDGQSGGGATFDSFSSPASSAGGQFGRPPEYQYTDGALTAIIIAAVLLVLPGLMLADMIAGMWSWHEPFILNSVLMSTIAGWLGLV